MDVFLAKQPKLDRKVELRILNTSISRESTEFKRFTREFSLLAKLDHPGIIKILDIGAYNDRPFYITTHRRAKSLESLLKETECPFSVKEAVKIGLTIGDAMKHMHKNGILHRNITTNSIFYDLKNLRSYIGEFAMVKLLEEENLEKSVWSSDSAVFFAPERFKDNALDERTDLYMLGGLLYRILTLKMPSPASQAPTGVIMQCSGIVKPSEHNVKITTDLETIILKLLETTPSQRYQSCGDFLSDLEGIQRNE